MLADLFFADNVVTDGSSPFPMITHYRAADESFLIFMDKDGQLELAVFGELLIAANQAYGAYSGNYNITVIK